MDYNLFGTGYVVVGFHEQTILRDFLKDIEETISSLRKGGSTNRCRFNE